MAMVNFQREDLPSLSKRETQVVRLLLEDKNIKTIAHELGLKPNTVWEYKHRAYKKLKVHTDVGLVREALSNGIVNPKKWLKPYLFLEIPAPGRPIARSEKH